MNIKGYSWKVGETTHLREQGIHGDSLYFPFNVSVKPKTSLKKKKSVCETVWFSGKNHGSGGRQNFVQNANSTTRCDLG